MHCEDPPCVPVCPTGASYKRAEDGIVLVDYDKCIGCKYCAWACPYGVRELDEQSKVMTKCTLCVDRIHRHQALPEAERKPACVMACPTNARLFGDVHDPASEVSRAIAERGGYTLMPELGTQPRQPLSAATQAPTARTDAGASACASTTRCVSKAASRRRAARRCRATGSIDVSPRDRSRLRTSSVPSEEQRTQRLAEDCRSSLCEPLSPSFLLCVQPCVSSLGRKQAATQPRTDMHPPWSMIFFTTLAGAAQGLMLALVGLEHRRQPRPRDPRCRSLASTWSARRLVLGLLGAVGLAAATFHLGHPLRAWRAVAMWRSVVVVARGHRAMPAVSWPCVALPGRWRSGLMPRPRSRLGASWPLCWRWLMYLCTGMIYAAVKAIRELGLMPITPWSTFMLLGLASGLIAVPPRWRRRFALPVALPLAQAMASRVATLLGAASRAAWALRRNLTLGAEDGHAAKCASACATRASCRPRRA